MRIKCKMVRVCSDDIVVKRAHLREDIREAKAGIARDERELGLRGLGQIPQVEVRESYRDYGHTYRFVFTVLGAEQLSYLTGPVNPRYTGTSGNMLNDPFYTVRPYSPLNLAVFERLSVMGPTWGRVNAWRPSVHGLELAVQQQQPGHLPAVKSVFFPTGQGIEQMLDYVSERGGL